MAPKIKYVPSKYVRVTVRELDELSHLMQSVRNTLAWQIEEAEEDASKFPTSRPHELCNPKQFIVFVPPNLCKIEDAVQILKVWVEKEAVWIDNVEVCPFFRTAALNEFLSRMQH